MEPHAVELLPLRLLVNSFPKRGERVPTVIDRAGFLRRTHCGQRLRVKSDPAPLLPFNARNPKLVRRLEMAPIRVKDLADSQKRIQPKRKRAVQMTVHVVARVDRYELRSLFLCEVAAHEFGFRNFEVLKGIRGQPLLLATEPAEGSQYAQRQALAAGVVAKALQVPQPIIDDVLVQLFD